MTITQRIFMCVVVTLTLPAATTLQAGEITSFTWSSGVASLAATSPPSAPTPNDDVALPDMSAYEFHVTQKDYTGIGPVDIVFEVRDNLGVTEYRIREGVQNNTGLDWSGYHLELGSGVGAGFVKSSIGDGLDFDAPFFNSTIFFNPSPGFFPTFSTPTEDDIIAGGGIFPDFSFAGDFVFHIDVPDGITEFTLRQSPIALGAAVPEPSTFALTIIGVLSLGMTGRRRRHR